MDDDLRPQIDQLRERVAGMAEHADAMLRGALHALEHGDLAAADEVIDHDAGVDRAYAQVQRGVFALIALHHPGGGDLRQLMGLVHVSLHVERMADEAVGVAHTTKRAAEDRGDEDAVQQLLELGGLAREVSLRARTAFLEDDAAAANGVTDLDRDVARLTEHIFQRLVRLPADDRASIAWSGRMIGLCRRLERYAGHGVDVAEQAVFVSTGDHVQLRVPTTD